MVAARPHLAPLRARRRIAVVAVPAALLAAGALADPAASTTQPVPPWSGYVQRTLQLPAGAYDRSLRDVDDHGTVLGTVGSGGGAAAVWDVRGRVTVLAPVLSGTEAGDLDDAGRVVGSAWAPTGSSGVRWTAVRWTDGVARPIDVPGATSSKGLLINRSGQIAGLAWTAENKVAAFVWSPATGVRFVTPFVPDDLYSPAVRLRALGDGGTVVGLVRWPLGADVTTGRMTAFRWTPSGGLVDLLAPELAHGDPSVDVTGLSLSETGLVAVSAKLASGARIARAVPESGPAVDLLAGFDQPFSVVLADAHGRVIGSTPWTSPSCPDPDGRWPAVWEPGVGIRLLPTGVTCGESVGAANEAGDVVGSVVVGGAGIGSAYVWDAARGLRTLDRCEDVPAGEAFPPCPFSSAWAVSEAGHVLGSGWKETGQLVWDPPEGIARVVSTASLDTTLLRGSSGFLEKQPWLAVGGDAVALLRVPVPAAPPGRRLVAARLLLHTTDAAGSGTATPMELRRALGGWGPTTTWSERGTVLGTRRLGVLGVVGAGERLSVRIDPSDVPWARGGSLELALAGTGTDSLRLWSREATAGLRPQVELIYR